MKRQLTIYLRKIAVTLFFCIISQLLFAQENTVNIISSGDGKTKDAATNAALRHCIEKTFGVFVTTNTTVVNDELVKDEVTNMASGNIVSYEVLSEIKENDNYAVTVSAVVSPDNIVKTFKSKGYSFEINGNVYAQNIQKEKYYKEQEPKIILEFLKKYVDYPIFDTFAIKVLEPYLNKDYKRIIQSTRSGVAMSMSMYYFPDVVEKFNNYLSINKYGGYQNVSISLLENDMIVYNEDANNSNARYNRQNEDANETSQTYAYPIIYAPRFNVNNASDLSILLKNFFNNICLKEPLKYKEKYGDIYEANFVFQFAELNKREKLNIRQESLKFNFRNPESVSIIKAYAQKLEEKANPNSLVLNNKSMSLSKKSYWAYQGNQNFVYLNTNRTYNSKSVDLNLADNFQNPGMYSSNITYQYKPVLIFFNVSEEELTNLKKLDFNWKTNVKINDTEDDATIMIAKKNITEYKNDTLKLFQYYRSSYTAAVQNFKSKNWDSALIHFESANLYINHIFSHKMAKQNLNFDTTTLLYSGYAAQNANNLTKALKYYKLIADYGVSKFNNKAISDIYKYILIKEAEALHETEHARYFTIANKLYPNENWGIYSWRNLSVSNEFNGRSNQNSQKKKYYFD